jgi:hypothetical protein
MALTLLILFFSALLLRFLLLRYKFLSPLLIQFMKLFIRNLKKFFSPYVPSSQVGSSELLSTFTKFFVFLARLHSNLCLLCSLRNKVGPQELLPTAYYINNHIFNM